MSQGNDESKQKRFLHIARAPELIQLNDRDVVAFFADAILKDQEGSVTISDPVSGTTLFSGSDTLSKDDRGLVYGRTVSGELVTPLRVAHYKTGGGGGSSSGNSIAPLKEVYSPRLSYDIDSNDLHLWFWTNICFNEEAPTAYDPDLVN